MSSSQEKKQKKRVKFTDDVQIYQRHGQEQYFEHMNELVDSIHESDSQSVKKLKSTTDELERISALNKEKTKAIEDLKEKLLKVKQEERLISRRNVDAADQINAMQLKFQKMLQQRDELQNLAASAQELIKNNSLDQIAQLSGTLIKKLEAHVKEQNRMIDEAKSELKYMRERHEKRVEAPQKELEDARKVTAKLEEDVESLRMDVEGRKRSICETEAANEQVLQKIAAVQEELQNRVATIEQLKLQEDEIRMQHQLERLNLNEQIQSVTDRCAKLEDQVQTTISENEKLKEEENCLLQRKLELQMEVEKTTAEIAAVEQYNEELRKEAAEELACYNNLAEEKQADIEKLQGLLEKETELGANYEKNLAEINQAIKLQTKRSSELNTLVRAAETERANILAELESSRSHSQSLDSQIESEQKVKNETELKITENAEKLKELKEVYLKEFDEGEKTYVELELSLSREYEVQETRYKDTGAQLEDQVGQLKAEIEKLDSHMKMFQFLNQNLF